MCSALAELDALVADKEGLSVSALASLSLSFLSGDCVLLLGFDTSTTQKGAPPSLSLCLCVSLCRVSVSLSVSLSLCLSHSLCVASLLLRAGDSTRKRTIGSGETVVVAASVEAVRCMFAVCASVTCGS